MSEPTATDMPPPRAALRDADVASARLAILVRSGAAAPATASPESAHE